MIRKASQASTFPVENLCGGQGSAVFTSLFARGELPQNVVKVTLLPGASCGEHTHETDGELFYFLDGELVLLEDGVETVVRAGDCEYCADGHSHGVINRSAFPGSYLAIMLK